MVQPSHYWVYFQIEMKMSKREMFSLVFIAIQLPGYGISLYVLWWMNG